MLGAIPSRFLMWILLLQWIYLLWNAYVSTKVFDTLLMPIYLNFRCSFWLLYRVVNAMLGEGCWEWFWDSKMLSLLVTLEIPNLTSLRDSLQEGPILSTRISLNSTILNLSLEIYFFFFKSIFYFSRDQLWAFTAHKSWTDFYGSFSLHSKCRIRQWLEFARCWQTRQKRKKK